MFAIPSPDLLVNLFASGAQIMGLLAVALGGAWFKKSRFDADAQTRRGSPWPLRVVVLLLVGVSTAFTLYVLQGNDEVNRRLQANLIRSSTEGGKKVGDTSLKTLAFSAQGDHPRALAAETLAEWMAAGKPVNIIDVREPEEVEMGQLPGAWARRYPDLRVERDGLMKPGMETVLICDSGNRSSELSDAFAKDGLHCWFVVGGCEKWVAENRPLVNEAPRSSIRDIPDYPNKNKLLLTAEVERLVREENALFLDVRYPEEVAKTALPGSINLTLRKQLRGEMESSLLELPRRPIIVPVYDKRSAFYGLIVGLRMHRLGLDFRGRYSLPHEYFVAPPDAAHLAVWKANRKEHTMFSLASGAMATDLDRLGRSFGSLLLAIFLVVLMARLLLLPLTLKGDRDQIELRKLAPKIADLRKLHAGDAGRVRREIFALHKQAKLTPVRNMLGSMVQLVLFILLFSAVATAAVGQLTPFLWLDGLGAADPLHILPIAVGVAFLGLMLAVAAKHTLVGTVLRVAFAGVITVAIWTGSAAVSIYLLINLGLMLAQRVLLARWTARREARANAPAPTVQVSAARPTVSLRDAEALPMAGRKAQRLSTLMRAGFPVPDGFVVAHQDGLANVEGTRAILAAFKRLGAERVAVRSSGMGEDGVDFSHAGEFDSILKVTRDRLLGCVDQVLTSLRRPHSGIAERCDEGGALVQAMVPAEYAGVLFTEDPACTGAMMVEMTSGLGDSLVSGQVDPEGYRFGRLTLRALQHNTAPIDLKALLELGRRAERLFGRAQDIEWAYARGKFFILQARDITCTAHDATELGDATERREAERARLLKLAPAGVAPAKVVLAQNELAELLPEPTPMSLALMNELWAKGGAVERAAARLGIPYAVSEKSAPYAVSVFGRLYVNRHEQQRRFARSVGALASMSLARGASAIERAFKESFLPRFRREVRLLEAVDPSRLALSDLVAAIGDGRAHFVRTTYVEAEVVNLASTFYNDIARRRLRRAGRNPAEVLGVADTTVLLRAVAKLRLGGEAAIKSALSELGHRAPHDFELAQPRYNEAPEAVRGLIAAARSGASASRASAAPTVKLSRVDQIAVANANRFEALKEEAKHEVLRELACLRALLVELGQRLELGDDVFWLLPEEVASCQDTSVEALRERIAQRRAAHAAGLELELPAELSFADLETVASPFEQIGAADTIDATRLHGLRVAGTGDVIGRARVVREPSDIDSFADGDVLIARFTDPRWMPLFRRARGIVTEVGGWLSHASIQAREHRLPAIVGVRGVMSKIHDGDLVCLRADGKLDVVEDRRQRVRATGAEVVRLRADDATLAVQLVDISETGLRVSKLDRDLAVGQMVEVSMSDMTARATIVHRQGESAGLRLHSPLARATRARLAVG
ncbi:MAG: YidC/Oxa1 family membrane protein insertase [Phycisphaerales bacterium]|nr:YidC/Oxa1 family membrane protein insertase [Phycisphaerales bacterium]